MIGKFVEVTPTVDTNQYASGDHLGTLHTLSGYSESSSRVAKLQAITIVDKDQQKSALDVFIFDASPTIASSDNGAANISDAEMHDKCIGHIVVAASDYRDIGSANSVAHIKGLNMLVKADPEAATPSNLYAFVVSRGTPTYTAAGVLMFKYHFEWV